MRSVLAHEIQHAIQTMEGFARATFNGLFRLDKETLNPSHVLSPQTEEEGTLNHFSIYSLYKDKQNILWVGTNAGGVNFCHPYNQRFKTIHPNLFLRCRYLSGKITLDLIPCISFILLTEANNT